MYPYVQLSYRTKHTIVLIICPISLQLIIIAQMLSIESLGAMTEVDQILSTEQQPTLTGV